MSKLIEMDSRPLRRVTIELRFNEEGLLVLDDLEREPFWVPFSIEGIRDLIQMAQERLSHLNEKAGRARE